MKGKLSKLLVQAYIQRSQYGSDQYAHLNLEIVPRCDEHDISAYTDQRPICVFKWQTDNSGENHGWYGGHCEVENLRTFGAAESLRKVLAVYEKAAKAQSEWSETFDALSPTEVRQALEAEGCEFGIRDQRTERVEPASQIKGAEFGRWEAQYNSGSTLDWCLAEYESEAKRLLTATLNEKGSIFRNSFDNWLQQGRRVVQTRAARPVEANQTWEEIIASPFKQKEAETAA